MMDAAARERRRRELAEFHRLFDLPEQRRVAALLELEREERDLAASLRRLLAAADADRRSDAAEAPCETDGAACSVQTGEVVGGRFRVLRLLGVGGMGEVHLAERIDGVEQRVALKRMRSDSPGSAARADRERRILARLAHPNIAGLVDTGLTASGQPWFAMDYIEGEPITLWCNRHGLDLPRRARLLAEVCRAVQFAHRNLVLHRDLKPSNILVDAEGRPRLLDFGIAKLLDATDPQQTQTLALTPAYAAPEQLRGEPATTASDVYQLGLVLYELTAGISSRAAREFADTRDAAAGLPRLEQALSGLISRDRAAAERVALHRAAGLDKLRRMLKGDLGRIVAKATADDPRERYDTAQMFAADLDRWADRLPVAAHRGSFSYRLRKLVRRHAVAAAAIVLLGLGLVALSVFALGRAHSERVQRERAELQSQRSETLLAFMRDIFREADPDNAHGEKLSPADLVGRAAVKLEQRTDLDAPTRALLRVELADVFNSIGSPDAALPLVREAMLVLEPARELRPAYYLKGAVVLAVALSGIEEHDAVLAVVDRSLNLARRTRTGERVWPATFLTLRGYALVYLNRLEEGEASLRAALEEYREAGEKNSADLSLIFSALGDLAVERGDDRLGLEFYRREKSELDADPTSSRRNVLLNAGLIGSELIALGGVESAIPLLESTRAELEQLFGLRNDHVIVARATLAKAYFAVGDTEKAAEMLDSALAVVEPPASASAHTQAMLRIMRSGLDLYHGRVREGVAALRAASALAHGSDISSPAIALRADAALGEALLRNGDYADACGVLERALAAARTRFVAGTPPLVIDIEDGLGRCRLLTGEPEQARILLRQAIVHASALQGDGKPIGLRSEIHELWVRWTIEHSPNVLDRLQEKREALVNALHGQDNAQIWQLDLLIDALRRQAGQAGIGEARRNAVEEQLRRRRGGAGEAATFRGLDGFFL